MSLRLQSRLQDLAERGITADKLTAEELRALVYACDRMDSPYSAINAELCEHPVKVCKGVWLWPVTAGAQIWLEEYAAKWWRAGTGMFRWAQVYALRNARDPEAFARLTSPARARAAILACALRFACHRGELITAVNRCYGIDPHAAPDRTPSSAPEGGHDFAAKVAFLEMRAGIPARNWLWGKSLKTMLYSWARLTAVSDAFGGKAAAEMDLERDEALANLARVVSAITERFEHEQNP